LNTSKGEKNEILKSIMSDLEISAYYDVLTGVPNSRYLARLLSDKSSKGPRCLILLDLRDFGSINKRFSHWKGDAYLSRFASMVLQSSRRNEHVIKHRPLTTVESPELIRKSSGGDEFYILLRGTVVDGLGYLSRLLRRRAEFELMANELLDAPHPFAFRAGLVSLAYDDSYELAVERVSQALCKAMEKPEVSVYWPELESRYLGEKERAVVDQAKIDFGDPHTD